LIDVLQVGSFSTKTGTVIYNLAVNFAGNVIYERQNKVL
jgi:hypothetical protein